MTPYDFVKEIQFGKNDIMTDSLAEKEYVPFVINRALSYEYDCVMQANEMNRRHHLDKVLQFHYLLCTVRSRRRAFQKWAKPVGNDDLETVKEFYHFSDKKAITALKILSEDQIKCIKQALDKGGLTGKHK